MSLFSLLILLIIVGIMIVVVRSIIRVYQRSKDSSQSKSRFPVFSIVMLSISLILLIVGTAVSLFINDGIGGALASLAGFASFYESHVRHKREAVAAPIE